MTEGRIVACKWVRLACQRHLRDLERWRDGDPDFPFDWTDYEVEDIRLFFKGLSHSKGEWAEQPIDLEPWQLFVLGSIFGWKRRADRMRRFRVALIIVPRKNTKSTMAAGIGLRLAFDDAEGGAEVYAVATKLKQAKVVWDEARRMVKKCRRLRERVLPRVAVLHEPDTASRFEPLGADSENLDGLNIHGATIDELHAHKTRQMWDVIDTGTSSRRQPLLFAITTAGYNLAGICYEQVIYLRKVLAGVLDDESLFGIEYTIDEGDDWQDRASWIKANPMYGISVKPSDLEDQAKRAKEIPGARIAFLTKHLNVWVHAADSWVDMAQWARAAQPFALTDLAGAPCWLGVDLASKSDVAAVVAVFMRDGQAWITPRFYLPAESVHEAAHASTAHYAGWATAGHLTLTEGNLIDFSVIREDIKAIARVVDCREIAFDPYMAAQIQTDLTAEGLPPVIDVPQTVKHLSAPMKFARDLLKDGKFHHDGNPVMAWMASNVVAREDANENVFPRKASANLKIDGYSAMLNALSRAMVFVDSPVGITVLG